jgi:hypothetical protein
VSYALSILPQHQTLLAASAIDPAVARERGYVSVDVKSRLSSAGFPDWQRRVPGLLIPVHDVTGAIVLHQYRPDKPRLRQDGKPVKYETPQNGRLVLDVPVRIREQLGDPSVPLWITEGARKADAAVSAGLCAVSLMGVWAWKGRNGADATTALGHWESVALKGRRVYVAFDSDVMVKAAVRLALSRFGAFLTSRGADVLFCYLPDDDGAKVGLDDYLAAGGQPDDLVTAATPELRQPPQLRPVTAEAPSIPPAVTAHLHTPPGLASDQDILARLVRALRVCGAVGEDRTAQLVYLAVMSRILADPVSVAVKGLSSSGKSFTVDTVLRFFPEEAVITMTAMSERALIYMKDEFSHRTIVLYEAVALREEREKAESNLTAYILRSLLSEGQIRYPVVTRSDSGELVTQVIEKMGPTNCVVTTTATSLHGENETRMLSLPTNDSAEQTRNIMRSIAAGPPEQAADFAEWHALSDWLAGLEPTSRKVVIPYARWLADEVPPIAVRLRRDFRALLRLIETHALMHQLTRPRDDRGRIIATEQDYLAIRRLVVDLMSEQVGSTVLPATRETVEVVGKLDGGEGVKVHDVAAALGIDRSAAQRRLASARERGYLVNDEDKRGKPARFRIGNPLPEEVVMLPPRVCTAQCTPPCTAFCAGPAGQDRVCTCAATAPGIETATCAGCGDPLDQALAAAGFTTHGGDCDAVSGQEQDQPA